MVRRWARAALLLATGGLLALGGLLVRHVTYGDVYALVDHARQGRADEVRRHLVERTERAAEAEKTALLDRMEAAAAGLVDEAASHLKDRVDDAAGDAKRDLHERLRGEAASEPGPPAPEVTPGLPSTR